jgi:peptidoglycan lytic transglycosylase G
MKKKFFAGIAAIIIISLAFTGWKFFGPTISTANGEFFYVKTGSGYSNVKQELLSKKYIGGSTWFDLASKILGYKTVKPGRYKITKGMSLFRLVRMLKNGSQTQVNFVITKLRTKEDLARKAGSMFECDSLQVINFLNNNDSLKKYNLDSNTVMAAVMPYTYAINWNITTGKLFQKFYIAYKNFWTTERKQKADSIHLSPIGVSTLASIIEEETNNRNDKSNIASVYLNRMAARMPLQADPTIKFAMKDFGLKRIYEKYLLIESPYNTYRNKGLPPGPVCTPSIETIDAVLDAPKTDYLYFVASSNLDGSSIFTTNYNDHIKYARVYQKALDSLFDTSKKANLK